MAIEICRSRAGSDSFGGRWNDQDGESFEQRSATREFIAIATGYADPSAVGPADIKAAAGVPIPGVSIYVSEEGLLYPYCLCESVTVRRRTENAFVFDITANYEEPERGGGETSTPPEDPETLAPTVTTQLTEHQITRWDDPVNTTPYNLPNGLLYSSPLVGSVSGLKFEVTQYENSFNAQTMIGRAHVVNNAAKSIDGVSYNTNSLLITDIKWDKNVKWFLDPTDESGPFVLTNRVKYTVEWKEYALDSIDDAGVGTTITCHWGAAAIEASSHHLTNPGDIGSRTLISDKLFQQYGSAYLKSDGTIHDNAQQGGIPPQKFYNSNPDGDFSFLRTT